MVADPGRAITAPDHPLGPTVLAAAELPWDGNPATPVPLILAAASSPDSTWTGAALFADPGDGTLQPLGPSGRTRAVIGTAKTALPDVLRQHWRSPVLALTASSSRRNLAQMKTLLTNFLHGPFDWIIIDTPPVLAVTDAVVVAPLVSGVTFVVGSEMTRRRLAERAIDTVLSSHPKQMAVVLNKVDFGKHRYYYARYYGHQYKNYYAEAV